MCPKATCSMCCPRSGSMSAASGASTGCMGYCGKAGADVADLLIPSKAVNAPHRLISNRPTSVPLAAHHSPMPPRLQRSASTSLRGPRPPSVALSRSSSFSDDTDRIHYTHRASVSSSRSYLSDISEDSVLYDLPAVPLRRRPHLVCPNTDLHFRCLSNAPQKRLGRSRTTRKPSGPRPRPPSLCLFSDSPVSSPDTSPAPSETVFSIQYARALAGDDPEHPETVMVQEIDWEALDEFIRSASLEDFPSSIPIPPIPLQS
jgi:hypothetical protein